MRSVSITILRIVIPVNKLCPKTRAGKVPAADIIDVAIAIIVDAIIGGFARVDPDVALEIRVVEVNTGVDNRDAVVWVTCVNVPRFRRIDVIVRGLVHAPELAEQFVIRGGLTVVHVVWFDVIDGWVGLQLSDRIHRVSSNMHECQPWNQRVRLHRSKANLATERISGGRIRCVLKADQNCMSIDVNGDRRPRLAHRYRALLGCCIRRDGLCYCVSTCGKSHN